MSPNRRNLLSQLELLKKENMALRLGHKQSISWKLEEVEDRLSNLDESLFQMDRPKVKTLKEALRRANNYLDQLLIDLAERQKEIERGVWDEITKRREEKESI